MHAVFFFIRQEFSIFRRIEKYTEGVEREKPAGPAAGKACPAIKAY